MKTFEVTVLRNALVEKRIKYTINANSFDEAKKSIRENESASNAHEIEIESEMDLEEYEVKEIIESKQI